MYVHDPVAAPRAPDAGRVAPARDAGARLSRRSAHDGPRHTSWGAGAAAPHELLRVAGARQPAPLQACGAAAPDCGCPSDRKALFAAATDGTATGPLHAGLVPQIAGSAGRPLTTPLALRARAVFDVDLRDVRVHDDATAMGAARHIAARAFTVGEDVYLGAPLSEASAGLRLLGHELTHVLQQRRGLARAALRGTGDVYEREADAGGDAYESGRQFHVATASGEVRGVQRQEDPAAEAERVGTEDSPYGLPFLGEANTPAELVDLMQQLAAEEDVARLGLVDERIAFPAPAGGDLVASATGPGATPPVQAFAAARPLPDGAPLQAKLEDAPLQRASVAGCYVPGVPPGAIGVLAHQQIQVACATGSPGCRGEVTIPGNGRMDLLRQMIPALDEVGEIKPASWLGRGLRTVAELQLAGYLSGWSAHTGLPAVPMWSFVFPGGPFFGNASQMLRAWGPDAGLYFYGCTSGRRRRVRVPVRVPLPVPVVTRAPSPAPSSDVSGRDVARGAAAVGAGIGIGYLVYRGVRMIPSLFPPLWPTIPANAAIP